MQTLNYALTVLITCGAIGATQALAEPSEGARPKVPHKTPAERFAAHDTDGSGGISLEEFTVVHEKRMADRKAHLGDKWDESRAAKGPSVEERFAKIDTDGDGSLSPDEMKAWGKARQGERKDRRGGGGPGGDNAPKPEPTEE